MKRYFPVIFALLAAACQSGPGPQPLVTTQGLEDFVFPAEGGQKTFSVQSDQIWTLSREGLDWTSLSRLAGAAGSAEEVTLKVERNTTGDRREGTLILGSGSYRKAFSVVQEFGSFVTPSAESLLLPSSQTEAMRLSVTSNVAWTLGRTLPEWLRIRPSEGGPGKTDLRIWADDNPADEARSYDFQLVSDRMEGYSLVRIVQEGLIRQPYLSIDGTIRDTLFFDPVPLPGEIIVRTNCNWTVTGVPDWVTVSAASGSAGEGDIAITFLPGTNDGRSEKNGVLTFATDNPDVPPVTIVLHQDGFSIKPQTLAKWNFGAKAVNTANYPDYTVGGSALVDDNPGSGLAYAVDGTLKQTSTFQYVNINPTDKTALAGRFRTTFSDASRGFVLVHPTYQDYFEIVLNGVDAEENQKLVLSAQMYIYNNLDNQPKTWSLTYSLDGGTNWSEGIDYSFTATGAAKALDIDLTVPLTSQLTAAKVLFRITANGELSGNSAFNNTKGMQAQVSFRGKPAPDYPITVRIDK